MFFCSTAALVVLTALLGYSMAPAPLEWSTLTWAMLGTTLCSAAANTGNQVMLDPILYTHMYTLVNCLICKFSLFITYNVLTCLFLLSLSIVLFQWLEVPFDSQMARTKSRVLVRSLIRCASNYHNRVCI